MRRPKSSKTERLYRRTPTGASNSNSPESFAPATTPNEPRSSLGLPNVHARPNPRSSRKNPHERRRGQDAGGASMPPLARAASPKVPRVHARDDGFPFPLLPPTRPRFTPLPRWASPQPSSKRKPPIPPTVQRCPPNTHPRPTHSTPTPSHDPPNEPQPRPTEHPSTNPKPERRRNTPGRPPQASCTPAQLDSTNPPSQS